VQIEALNIRDKRVFVVYVMRFRLRLMIF